MPVIDFIDIGDVLSHEVIRNTIVSIDPESDTCVLNTGESALIFYHCSAASSLRSNGAVEGGAEGFDVGDQVFVLRKFDGSSVRVIGHVDGIRQCKGTFSENYYIFYRDGTTLKVANCNYDAGITVLDAKSYDQIYTQNFTNPVVFHMKKFYHNVNGVLRNLYFVATSLYINPNPFLGWVNFALANPSFALVTNNSNTKIPSTAQLIADLNEVNALINTTCTYVSDPVGNDNWFIIEPGGSGDCEDMALGKAKLLLDKGYPASAIHIEGGMIDGAPRGHAWLVVQTSGGDYALDTSNNSIMVNSDLQPTPTTEYTGRRRQIGSKWAFISSYGWMLNSQNVAMPSVCWYVLDPLLNIFYELFPGLTNVQPFYRVRTDASILSGPSVNFSADNSAIYVASGAGIITAFKLNENSLDVISQYAYTSGGFVGRDGQIVAPTGLEGNQDSLIGVFGTVELFDGVYHLATILPERIGLFTILDEIKVVSKDGYYEYAYRYSTGEMSDVTEPSGNFIDDPPREGTLQTLFVELNDNSQPFYYHEKSVIERDADNVILNVVNDPSVVRNRHAYLSLINKVANNPMYMDYLLLDPLIYPAEWPYDPDAQQADICIPFGSERIPFYDTNYETYGGYYPYMWNHLEVGGDFFQGLLINRPTPAGDDLKRMYKNGASCLSSVAAAVGATEANLLGLVCVPNTNRLN